MHFMFLEMSFMVTETKPNEDLHSAEYYSLVIIIKFQFGFGCSFCCHLLFEERLLYLTLKDDYFKAGPPLHPWIPQL